MDVLNRTEEATLLLSRADDLEEMTSRAHKDNTRVTNGLLDDKLAIISISGASENLGDILDVNAGFVRFLGIPRSDLVGTKIDRCMPQPFQYMIFFVSLSHY